MIKNSNQIWNENPTKYKCGEFPDDLIKVKNDLNKLKSKSMTVKEFYEWAKSNNYLDFQIACGNLLIRKLDYSCVCHDYISIDHDEKIVTLDLITNYPN